MVQESEIPASTPLASAVQLWRPERRKRVSNRGWVLAATFACLPDPEEVRQASKRRRPPPSPSVSQMAWSCDDTKVPNR